MWETWVQFLDWDDPLEKEKATHYIILAWRIPGVTKNQTQLSNLHFHCIIRASLIAQLVKNPLVMQETLVRFLSQEDPLEKG